MEGEARVRAAFAEQAGHCARLGSPFTAALLAALEAVLDRGTALGRRVLDWPGAPDSRGDALPLRLAGGLHALVRRGALPDLAGLYPCAASPAGVTAPEALRDALRTVLAGAGDALAPWLGTAPQTNEVGRSAVLMAGLLVVAARAGAPHAPPELEPPELELLELGASAGLNLVLDRYAHDLGGRRAGRLGSPLVLVPAWHGPPPPDAPVRVAARAGVDLNPLGVADPADRERLVAYVWPDQAARLARIEAALALAAADPPRVEREHAAPWLARRLAAPPVPGRARVVLHSIAFQYFGLEERAAIEALMAEAGSRATIATPLAWLRYEVDPAFDGRPSLRLRLWPDGTDLLLAEAHPHASEVRWRA